MLQICDGTHGTFSAGTDESSILSKQSQMCLNLRYLLHYLDDDQMLFLKTASLKSLKLGCIKGCNMTELQSGCRRALALIHKASNSSSKRTTSKFCYRIGEEKKVALERKYLSQPVYKKRWCAVSCQLCKTGPLRITRQMCSVKLVNVQMAVYSYSFLINCQNCSYNYISSNTVKTIYRVYFATTLPIFDHFIVKFNENHSLNCTISISPVFNLILFYLYSA